MNHETGRFEARDNEVSDALFIFNEQDIHAVILHGIAAVRDLEIFFDCIARVHLTESLAALC